MIIQVILGLFTCIPGSYHKKLQQFGLKTTILHLKLRFTLKKLKLGKITCNCWHIWHSTADRGYRLKKLSSCRFATTFLRIHSTFCQNSIIWKYAKYYIKNQWLKQCQLGLCQRHVCAVCVHAGFFAQFS